MMPIYANTTADLTQPISVEILSYRAFEKNTLKSFVSLQIDPPGVVLHDLTYHEKNDSHWFSFPAKPPRNDGDRWLPYIELPDRALLKAFQAAALEALDRYIAVGGGI